MTDSAEPRERLVLTCVPALVAVLLRAESDKGDPLMREEVESIRDNATVLARAATRSMNTRGRAFRPPLIALATYAAPLCLFIASLRRASATTATCTLP